MPRSQVGSGKGYVGRKTRFFKTLPKLGQQSGFLPTTWSSPKKPCEIVHVGVGIPGGGFHNTPPSNREFFHGPNAGVRRRGRGGPTNHLGRLKATPEKRRPG